MGWNDQLPWEPTTFIFRGYNPYFWGVNPSFFMVLGSKCSILFLKTGSMLSQTKLPAPLRWPSKLWTKKHTPQTDQWFSGPFIGWNKLVNQAKHQGTAMMVFCYFLFVSQYNTIPGCVFFVFLKHPQFFWQCWYCNNSLFTPMFPCFLTAKNSIKEKKQRTFLPRNYNPPPTGAPTLVQVREAARNGQVHRSLQAARSDLLDTLPTLL